MLQRTTAILRRAFARALPVSLTAALAGSLLAFVTPAAHAAGGTVTVATHAANAATVQPGGQVSYTFALSCTDYDDPCNGVSVVYTLDSRFTVTAGDIAVPGGATNLVKTAPGTNVATFTADLAAGYANTVTIIGHLKSDVPHDDDGDLASSNVTATFNSTPSTTADVTVELDVPLIPGVQLTKSITPESSVKSPGATTQVTLTAKNTSNATVDELTFQDPTDALLASGNPFSTYLTPGTPDTSGITAASKVVSYYCDGDWFPSCATPLGVKVVATGLTLAQNATAAVTFPITQTAAVSGLSSDFTATNTASATVGVGGQHAGATGTDTYLIGSGDLAVDGLISFSPLQVTAGESATMTLRGQNTDPKTVDKLTLISEQQSAPQFWFDGMTVTGWGEIHWPAGAVSADLTFRYQKADTTTYLQGAVNSLPCATVTTPDTLPPLSCVAPDTPATDKLIGIGIGWTGSMATNAQGTVAVTVASPVTSGHADENGSTPGAQWTNTLQVASEITTGAYAGSIGNADRSAVLTVNPKQVKVGDSCVGTGEAQVCDTQVTIAGTLYDKTGSSVVVQLKSQVAPRPTAEDGSDLSHSSTTGAQTFVIEDTAADHGGDNWWTGLTATAIPTLVVASGYTLKVEMWDGSGWTALDVNGAAAGTDLVGDGTTAAYYVFDGTQQAAIQGLRFTWSRTDGVSLIPEGTSFSAAYRAAIRDADDVAALDVFASWATATAANADSSNGSHSVVAGDDVQVQAVPGDGAGGYSFDKVFESSNEYNSRSQSTRRVKVYWTTAGRDDLTQAVVTDKLTAGDANDTLASSFYDEFDLYEVQLWSPGTQYQYDQITAVQLYNRNTGQWEDATNFHGPYDGPAWPYANGSGVALTAAEQESTIGARVVFAPSDTHRGAAATDPLAPAAGSGLAPVTDYGSHQVFFQFRVRDFRRSAPTTPVLGTTLGTTYNTGAVGYARNTAWIQYYDSDSPTIPDATVSQVADAKIDDNPLRAEISKTWAGGPVAVPDPVVPHENWPTTRATITATNWSGQVTTGAKVDSLTITEPVATTPDTGECTDSATTDPFEVFDLIDIIDVRAPLGATATTVRLTYADTTTADFSIAQAEALTEAQLADVVKVEVTHTGRINAVALASAGSAQLQLDFRLRETHRSNAAVPVGEDDAQVCDIAGVTIHDTGLDAGGLSDPVITGFQPSARANAQMDLSQTGIGVSATKAFSPSTITELAASDHAPVTVTLTGQPTCAAGGGCSRATSMTLTDTDADFWEQYDLDSIPAITLATPITRVVTEVHTGPDPATGWQTLSGGTTPSLSGVTQADVDGIRFTFDRADGAKWENPENPVQTVAFTVVRRDALRSDSSTSVVTDMPGNAAGPNAVAGVTENTVDAAITGIDQIGVDGDDNPIFVTGDGAASASLRFAHAQAGITVTKLASGASVLPGDSFTYTLRVKNTGDGNAATTDADLSGIVVTDTMPVDGSSLPVMQLDPSVEEPITYSLGGDPEPTVTPTTGANGSLASLVFAFPAGAVLEAGATWDITIRMTTRPGLATGDYVNGVGVVAAQPFDYCGSTHRTPVATTDACAASTTVSVSTAHAVRSQTFVKAEVTEDHPDRGAFSTKTGVTCTTANGSGIAAGYYANPCVPVTDIGQAETWLKVFTNSGNQDQSQVVAYDMLPAVGDTGAVNTAARGSQWRPALTSAPVLVGAPEGVTLTTDYIPDTSGCVASLVGCADWTTLTGSTDLTTVKALRYTLVFDSGHRFTGAQEVALTYTTETPATAPTASYPIAYGSVGSVGTRASDSVATPPSEGLRVGVSLATGAIRVTLDASGTYSHLDELDWPLRLTCDVGGEALTLTGNTATLADDGSFTIANLPVGATCDVEFSDPDYPGTALTAPATPVVENVTTDLPVQVVIDADASVSATYTATSTILDASGAAVDEDGSAIAASTSSGTYACTFLGDTIASGGFGPLANGAAATLIEPELPTGTACVFTDDDGRVATAPATATGTAALVLTVAPATYTVTLTQQIAGAQATWYIDQATAFPYTFACTWGTAALPTGTATLPGGGTKTWTGIPSGASCTLVQTQDWDADSVAMTGDQTAATGSKTFTVTADQAVTVTDTFSTTPGLTVEDPQARSLDCTALAPCTAGGGAGDVLPELAGSSPVLEYVPTQPITIDVTSFTGGTATYSLVPTTGAFYPGESAAKSGSLAEDPANPGSYPLSPGTLKPGRYTVTVTIDFGGGVTVVKEFDIFIDPSGTVVDESGTLVPGATTTLYRVDAVNQAALDLDPTLPADCTGITEADFGSGDVAVAADYAAPATNPQTTAADGAFSWLTRPGCYLVRAEKTVAGTTYHGTSAVLAVAPEHINLVILLVGLNTPPGGYGSGSGGTLPQTGPEVLPQIGLGVTGLALAAGAVLLAWPRRRTAGRPRG